jgi:hypothetical protein
MIRITHTQAEDGALTFTMQDGEEILGSLFARIACQELQILTVDAKGGAFDALFRAALNFARNHGINRATVDIEQFFGKGCSKVQVC